MWPTGLIIGHWDVGVQPYGGNWCDHGKTRHLCTYRLYIRKCEAPAGVSPGMCGLLCPLFRTAPGLRHQPNPIFSLNNAVIASYVRIQARLCCSVDSMLRPNGVWRPYHRWRFYIRTAILHSTSRSTPTSRKALIAHRGILLLSGYSLPKKSRKNFG